MGFRLIDGFDRAGLEVVFGEEEVLAALLNLGFGSFSHGFLVDILGYSMGYEYPDSHGFGNGPLERRGSEHGGLLSISFIRDLCKLLQRF